MDMNTNRYEKLMQVPPRGAERASSDGVTIEEYKPVDQQRTMRTVAEVYTNFADKSEPTLYQGTAVAAEEAGTDILRMYEIGRSIGILWRRPL